MSRLNRVLLCVCIAVIASGIYAFTCGPQTMLTLIARYKYRGITEAAEVPVPLADLSISTVQHKTVVHCGYEYELPWDDVDEQKSRGTGPIYVTAFKSGNALWFSTFPPREFVKNVLDKTGTNPQSFRQLFGNEAFESDYGFMHTMLPITPDRISPFMSKQRATANSILLLIKVVSIPKADSGIFSISAGDFKGFQFGNPQRRPISVSDELYSDDGGVDLIFFQKTDGSAPTISQAEINRIFQSIHKASPEQSPASHSSAD